MWSNTLLCLLLGLLLVALPGRTQSVNMGRPPEIHSSERLPSAETVRSRMNNIQLQKDAKELGELCSSIPADMDSVKQGLFPKDVVEKLKHVEKLSKRLREELAP